MPGEKIKQALGQAIPVAEAATDVHPEENVPQSRVETVSVVVKPTETAVKIAAELLAKYSEPEPDSHFGIFEEPQLVGAEVPASVQLDTEQLDAELVARVLGHFGLRPAESLAESVAKVAAHMGVPLTGHAETLQNIGVRLGMSSREAITKNLLS